METIKKYTTKRLLGLLLILCMVLPLLPALQAHAEIDITTKITIFNMDGQLQELNATYPYLKNGERAKSGKLGKDGCTDMSTLFWTVFYRTIYLNFLEFICKYKIIYLIPSRVNKLAIARP